LPYALWDTVRNNKRDSQCGGQKNVARLTAFKITMAMIVMPSTVPPMLRKQSLGQLRQKLASRGVQPFQVVGGLPTEGSGFPGCGVVDELLDAIDLQPQDSAAARHAEEPPPQTQPDQDFPVNKPAVASAASNNRPYRHRLSAS